MRAVVVILLTWLASCDPFTTTDSTVEEGIGLFEKGDYENATARFEEAREKIPERAELFFDLGSSQLALGKFDDADVSFSRALESAGEELKPLVFANLGLARLKKALAMQEGEERKQLLAKAVDALEKAVLARPDMESSRRDLELALLHLFPPCEKREDKLEPNDGPDQAADAAQLKDSQLLLCPSNKDFYKVPLKAGDRLKSILAQTGAEAEVPPPGVELLDPSGAIVGMGRQDGASVTAACEAAVEGTYQIKVSAADDEEHPYTLSHEVLPSCASMQEALEPNDSAPKASPIDIYKLGPAPAQEGSGAPPQPGQQPPGLPLRVCPGDHDWFRFELKKNESLLLQIVSQPISGALKAEVTDAQGLVVAEATEPKAVSAQSPQPASASGAAEPEQKQQMLVLLDVPGDATFKLHVWGDSPQSESPAVLLAIVRPPCPEGDDEMEENDDRAAAHVIFLAPEQSATGSPSNAPLPPQPAMPQGRSLAPLPPQPAMPGAGGPSNAPLPPQPAMPQGRSFEKLGRRCEGDDDWFAMDLRKDEEVQFQIGFQHSKGDLKLEMFVGEEEKAAAQSDKSSDEQPGEGFAIKADKDSRYLFRVTGDEEVTNFYSLSVKRPDPNQGDKKDQQDQQEQQKDKEQEQKEKEKKQEEEQKQEQKKPIEQMMDQMDQQKPPNLEAQKALRKFPNAQVPGGKTW